MFRDVPAVGGVSCIEGVCSVSLGVGAENNVLVGEEGRVEVDGSSEVDGGIAGW